jgi:hypothetical protein
MPPPVKPPVTPSGPALVAGLDTGLPLTLLPVRLATRFHRPTPGSRPTELLVRIFPDLLHADGHQLELTGDEIAFGMSYWEKLWRAGGDATATADAHHWAAAQLGAPRAAWVAHLMHPTNPRRAPTAPVSPDAALEPPPSFPSLEPRTASRATLARLLPDRWCVVVRRSVEYEKRVWTRPVRRDLAMAPNLTDVAVTRGVRDLLAGQDLLWMADFDEAEAAGMAVRVPWRRVRNQPFVTEMIVFGVRGDNEDAAAELGDLLDAHRFTTGLEIVPQGTPTNNTDTVRSGFSHMPADLTAFVTRQLASPPVRRPRLRPAWRLGTIDAADAAAIACGLEGRTAFDHAEHASLRSGSWGRDMNRTLWPATIGYLVTHLLAADGVSPLDPAARTWMERWFRDWVRGPGLLPVFRVGGQPYGLLPVARFPESPDELGSSRTDGLREILLDLGQSWSTALSRVAHFSDLDAERHGTARAMDEEALRLAQVLGAVPHPTSFRLRAASDRYEDIAAEWAVQIAELERLLETVPDALGSFYDGTLYEDRMDIPINQGALSEQSLALSRLRDVAAGMIDGSAYATEIAAVRDHIDLRLRPLTAAHEMRSETETLSAVFSDAHLPTPGDPALWYVQYGADGSAADGTFPRLRLLPEEARHGIAARLDDYAADAEMAAGFPRPAYPLTASVSLLDHLIRHAITSVDGTRAGELAAGLAGLADLMRDDQVADPEAELELRLRETLGLATHRYDAWVTSVANQRLATLRAARPAGVQVGGYGWLVNLAPDEGSGPDSHGFIHAPSLDHAATAAVLRSAWLAYAADPTDTPFGVDLSSERVRRAMWLLEGVRNGVDLAELLGGRLERRLHDDALSHLIADIREEVLIATGHPNTPATAIVDGLAIATAYAERAPTDDVFTRLERLRNRLPADERRQLSRLLRESVADLDATADLLTAQAVHSTLRGNLAEASATLSVAGSGAASIPPIRMASVHRESQVVNHRVVALLPPVEAPNSATLLAIADPSTAAWCAALLPAPDDVPVSANVGDSAWDTTLGAIGMTSAEVVAAAAPSAELGGTRLGGLLAALARLETGAGARDAVSFPADPTPGSLAAVALAAGALRSAIGVARPLRGEDLADDPELSHGVDVAEFDARRLAVADALAALADEEPEPGLLLDRIADFAALDLEGLVAALVAGADTPSHVRRLLAKARRRAAALRALLPDGFAQQPPARQAELLAERIAASLSLQLPVLPRIQPANPDGLVAAFSAGNRRMGSQTEALSWLHAVGQVHQAAGLCGEALDLAEAVHPRAIVALSSAQLPDVPGEPWVAIDAPSDERGRVHILSVTDAATALGTGATSGLIFDAWTEPIPGRSATTGLAVHFDKPGAQPPQAVLLALPPETGPWTVDEIETTLFQTLRLAQTRAVGPETLQRWGHSLPSVFLRAPTYIPIIPDEELP